MSPWIAATFEKITAQISALKKVECNLKDFWDCSTPKAHKNNTVGSANFLGLPEKSTVKTFLRFECPSPILDVIT